MSVSLLLLAGLLGQPSTSEAESVGSPSSVLKKHQWIHGIKVAFVERGVTKSNIHGNAFLYEGSHVRGYGLTDWLSVYAMIGGAYMRLKETTASNGFGANLVVSGQVKAKLWESPRYGLEWDASTQYLYSGAPHRKNHNQGHWNEWQFATSAAKSFGRIKPYGGVKFSLVNLNFKVRKNVQTTQEGTYKADGVISPFFGLDTYFGEAESWVVNVEGSFVNGRELDMMVSYRF